MAKTVEVTFAIGASLGGSFNSTFGKAGQSFEALQKQLTSLQQQSGQISDFQKLQDTVNKNQASMELMRQNSQALDTQMAASTERTAGLKSQYGNAQAEVERLNAVLVRNKDAYQAAQLNAESLKNQIQNSNGSTAELQKRYEAAQAEVRRLGDAVKQNSTDFRSAQQNAKRLKTEMKASAKETKDMQKQSRDLTAQANKLQTGLNNDRKALAHMKMELSFAGIATKQLTEHQAQLEAQTKRVTDAQNRLKAAQANFEAARQQLSWNNIKGDIMTSAGLAYSLYKPMKQAADFESAMARVNAVAFTGLGKSDSQKALDAEEFQKLQEQARELGRATQYTAVQVANTQEVLVRAGFKSNEVISAMPGLLSMAAAEGMDLSSAADIAASTLRGFQLSADQSGRVADVLAQTSAASNTSIAGLGESMKMVAPVAASLGVSIEQTSAMLGVMANNGIKGTESGTALRNAFLRLSQEPKAVAESLSQLGIASRTADGNMRSLPSIMLALSKRMKDIEPVAEKLGISFRDLSIYTALLAKNGIKGANANLMMSQAFSQLSKNSNSVQKALKRFNITAYTKNGELKDFTELLREIGTAISGLDEKTQKKTLSQIFGGEDAAIAAQTWIKSLNDGSWFDMDKAAEGAKGVS
ncbi:MAG: phage tail tape measure protein, partial [Synergistaceae bacterium]|nr:phage tail tape measure protein [Synergistaceae bacterium]